VSEPKIQEVEIGNDGEG